MPRLRRVARMCSSTLSVNCEKAEKDTQRYPDCRSPISQRSPVSGLRQAIQGKGVILKRVETAGVYPLVRPRGVSAVPRRGARRIPSLRFSEKLSAR